jgi:integrase
MPLTDVTARQAKPREKPYKLFDGLGLYLEVTPQGSKHWRLKYRFDGKEKRISFGPYPEVRLADARDKRTDARRMLRDRIDPAQQRKDMRNKSINLETVVRDWHEARRAGWTERHASEVLQSFEKDIFPTLGVRPIGEITRPEMYEALRKIEIRGALEIASRVRQRCHAAFEHAITRGIVDKNPVPPPIALTSRGRAKSHAMLPLTELPEFLAKLEGYNGATMARLALKLTILTMTRTVEVRGARWVEFDFDGKVWNIPAERMKTRVPHAVPLSKQALAVLAELKKLTGIEELLFPGNGKGQTISENTMLFALYRMGYYGRATVHGFRALASTILNESGQFRSDVIERALAHKEPNEIRAAYNRADYLDERRRLAQWWADYLDEAHAC